MGDSDNFRCAEFTGEVDVNVYSGCCFEYIRLHVSNMENTNAASLGPAQQSI